jgi:hypothetical protein
VVLTGRQQLCSASMRYRIYSCASSCCHNRKLFEIPVQFHLVKDCITRVPFPYTSSLHLLNSVPRRERESRQFANILLGQIYIRREQKTQKTSHKRIHLKFLTRFVGETTPPDDPKACLTCSWRAHIAQNAGA